MNTIYYDSKEIVLPETVPDGMRFGPTDGNGGMMMRTSVDPENTQGGLQIVDGRYIFSVDLTKGAYDSNGNLSKQPPYRSEFTDWPWMLNLPAGTFEQISFEYMMTTPVNMQTPVSVFQSYARASSTEVNGVCQQLEMAGKNQCTNSSQKPGQIQIINQCAIQPNGKGLRIWTDFVPQQNVPFIVTLSLLHQTKDRGGFFKVVIDGETYYESTETTLYPGFPYASQPKFGIYHHYLRTNAQDWLKPNLDAGHTKCQMTMGPVSIIRFNPNEGRPSYVRSLNSPIRPSEMLKDYYGSSAQGNYDKGYKDGANAAYRDLEQYAEGQVVSRRPTPRDSDC